jgi:hypothetical protein
MCEAGTVVWPSSPEPLWTFDWRLADSPDQEGVVIRSARFRGRQVFYKASLPSLRVDYSGKCGPFKDPLNYNNAQATSRCPGSRVCTYSYVSGGFRGLAVESYHRISAYRLTHRWVFWDDGMVMSRLYSAGLYCPNDHRHHAYWRFDFDIEGSANDLAFEYNSYAPDTGWGAGWHPKTYERTRLKNPSSSRRWAIMDKGSQHGYFIIPGGNDGVADSFAPNDIWFLRYHGSEDRNGNQGSAASDGLDAYINSESTDGQDVVLWYCAHLSHHADSGGDDWHSAGPDLVPFRWD